MNSYAHFECPKCGYEHEVEIDLGEHLVYFESQCDDCGYKFTKEEEEKIYNGCLEDGWGSAIDSTYDRLRD